MNNKYTFNKYGNYLKDSTYDVMLITETNNNYLQFDGTEKYICGDITKKIVLENKKNNINNTRIRVLDKPYTGQLYFDNYYQHPIIPIQQVDNGLEKWQLNQPLSYNKNINGEYPIQNINDTKLIARYDNPGMYRRIFFNQNDSRI